MQTNVFSVFDSKAGSYAQPFYSPTIGSAIRAFIGAISDPNTMLSKHPSDFSLMHLGSFDDDTGLFTNLQVPLNLGVAISFIAKAPANV